MADEMSLTQLPLTIIVAATAKNGIGKGGGLPWPMLKKDMAYFARVTKRVPMPKDTGSLQSDALKEKILTGTRQNVVIMGRKTWESIPPKFRPLKDRTNIVISSQGRAALQPLPDDVVVASDITSGLQTLEELVKEGKSQPVGRAYIIGGTSIYKAALELPQLNRILLTRIGKVSNSRPKASPISRCLTELEPAKATSSKTDLLRHNHNYQRYLLTFYLLLLQEYDCDTFFPVQLDASKTSSVSVVGRRHALLTVSH